MKDFDARLATFKLGSNDRRDRLNVLGSNFNSSGMRGTAAQNYCMLRIFSYFIGDLVPVDDEAWELNILLKGICEIVFAPVIDVKWLTVLDQQIHDHHSLLIKLDSNPPACTFFVT